MENDKLCSIWKRKIRYGPAFLIMLEFIRYTHMAAHFRPSFWTDVIYTNVNIYYY